jgi:hypothetical protein
VLCNLELSRLLCFVSYMEQKQVVTVFLRLPNVVLLDVLFLQESTLRTSESASCIHFVAAKAMSQGSVKPEMKSSHFLVPKNNH